MKIFSRKESYFHRVVTQNQYVSHNHEICQSLLIKQIQITQKTEFFQTKTHQLVFSKILLPQNSNTN